VDHVHPLLRDQVLAPVLGLLDVELTMVPLQQAMVRARTQTLWTMLGMVRMMEMMSMMGGGMMGEGGMMGDPERPKPPSQERK